eukprot:COSAG02_NODE_36787_length_450_cov_1.068376_1_plen_92_part_10
MTMDQTFDFASSRDHQNDHDGKLHVLMPNVGWELQYIKVHGRRLELYPDEGAVDLDDFVCKIPLDICEMNVKDRRDDRPTAFCINISDKNR